MFFFLIPGGTLRSSNRQSTEPIASGKQKNVFAYKMICRDTIEEKIVQLQQRKKQLAEDLVGEEEGFVKSLSEDDIKFLFS